MHRRILMPAALAAALLLALLPVATTSAAEPIDPGTPIVDPVLDPTPAPTPDVTPAPTPDPTATPDASATAARTPLPVARTTEAQQIIRIARLQLGDHWRYGAAGPRTFDCSGLVLYAYRKAGDLRFVANGHLRSARALYRYFKAHGLASRSHPKPGDLVIWGGGTHVGIYVGGGKAISTLLSGVRVHGVFAVTARFTTYLHTGMWKRLAK